jgi:dihydroorotate dehydrogenase
MIYKRILKPILFRFDPEDVHDLFISTGELLGRFAITRSLVRSIYGRHSSSKIYLSAGFDYNGRLTRILPCIGFGGEEIGSVTARPCAGNPKPRLTRLPKSRSIIVNKGLKNEGVDAIIARLKATNRAQHFVLGISIARTNDQASAQSVQAGIDDYAYSFKRLNEESVGDYYTINISCPNAFGGETFAKPELLAQLLPPIMAIQNSLVAERRKPIYVKMPINMPWDQFARLLDIIDKNGLHGIIIGNLNKDYGHLDVRSEAPRDYAGGLSGKPCQKPSTELIHKTRLAYGNRFTIFGVGGIMSPETALEKIAAGADTIQLITGMIYEGPGLIGKIARALR